MSGTITYPNGHDTENPVVKMAAAMAQRELGINWDALGRQDGGWDHYIVLAWAAYNALSSEFTVALFKRGLWCQDCGADYDEDGRHSCP